MFNKKQLITIAVGALFTWLAGFLKIGIAPEDIQNALIGIIYFLFTLFSHDANGVQSFLMEKTNWMGAIGLVFWTLTMVCHVHLGDFWEKTITSIILTAQGYYTLNHSGIVHEINGTVGEKSPAFK